MAVSDLVKQDSVERAVATLRKGGVKSQYENFIGGRWVAPLKGRYFTDYSPINGEPICEIARSSAEDVEKALDAAHAVKDLWGRTAPALRSSIPLKIADKWKRIWSFWPSPRLWITVNRFQPDASTDSSRSAA